MDVQAVDLNPAHVALLKLKLTAARHLPHYEAFRAFFAEAGHRQQSAPVRAVRGPAPRARGARLLGQARSRRPPADLDVQPQPLQPRPARPHHPARPRRLPAARQAARSGCWTRAASPSSAGCSRTSWRRCSTASFVRKLADLPAAYFGLGIPPAQFDALKADAGGNLATLLRSTGRAARLRLPDPGELVRLAGLRPAAIPARAWRCRPTCGRRTSS